MLMFPHPAEDTKQNTFVPKVPDRLSLKVDVGVSVSSPPGRTLYGLLNRDHPGPLAALEDIGRTTAVV